MPNETYCNIIATTDGELRDNILFKGDAISKPIGAAVEEKAVELFKNYCNVLGYDETDHCNIEDMVEDGCLCTHNDHIKVYINWPQPQ